MDDVDEDSREFRKTAEVFKGYTDLLNDEPIVDADDRPILPGEIVLHLHLLSPLSTDVTPTNQCSNTCVDIVEAESLVHQTLRTREARDNGTP